ncbi:MAG: hypothetical protein SCH71_16595 [Desulfobulbaceae bacterium]|nr:hypothetical protein [Desulfobulbaceae bacterium]
MEIKKKVYISLTPTQRAAAFYAAISRNDNIEAEKLIEHAQRGRGDSKAIFGLSQALEAYNFLAASAVRKILMHNIKTTKALSYCDGWLDAGGSTQQFDYINNFLKGDVLSKIELQMWGELEAVKQAAREWCENIGVPMEVFSGPLSYLPLSNKRDPGLQKCVPVDEEILEIMRSVFNEIKLSW